MFDPILKAYKSLFYREKTCTNLNMFFLLPLFVNNCNQHYIILM